MFFILENKGRAPRNVTNKSGAQRILQRGEPPKRMELKEGTALAIKRAMNGGGPLQIKADDDEAVKLLESIPAATKRDFKITGNLGDPENSRNKPQPAPRERMSEKVDDILLAPSERAPQEAEVTTVTLTDPAPAQDVAAPRVQLGPAEQLIAEADDIPMPQLRQRAKRLLGKNWPGGNPTKQQIINFLSQKTD